ncbi:efflux RND transporter periplasmic adaptor subunit [Duganella sp. FT80W]|uniref:Efflux RND transporter periplasmic adaptor subunit n=1 Tax=Duganella guangzhouensis TaxID=2666084 RepID=A0A6I2L4Y7_9BURK|nr:efflux RND transporter periplasmic adaptor subunit [Duganella guangzhouensis]
MNSAPVKSRRRLVFAAIAVLLILALILYQWFKPPPMPQLVLSAVNRGDIEQTVEATGILKPSRLVSVGAQASGRIEKLYVKLGDKVKAGDLIAEIDSRTQMNSLESARATLRSARASRDAQVATQKRYELTLARQERMLAAEATSRSDYEEARANVENTRAQIAALEAEIAQHQTEVATAETNLGYTRITAPIDGTVLAVVAKQGQNVNAVQSAPTIVMLGNLSTMTVYAQISEADVVRTNVGQEVFFTILGNHERRYNSKLRDIAPAPESVTNEDSSSTSSSTSTTTSTKTAMYYNGLFDIDNADGVLRTYMTAQVSIVLGRAKGVLLVPSAALGERAKDGSYTVQVAGPEGRPQPRKVTVGLDNQAMAEVKSGLREGEKVVVGEADTTKVTTTQNRGPGPGGPPPM